MTTKTAEHNWTGTSHDWWGNPRLVVAGNFRRSCSGPNGRNRDNPFRRDWHYWSAFYYHQNTQAGSLLSCGGRAQPQRYLGSGWSSNDDLLLSKKVWEQVKGHSFNLAVFAAEGKESWDLITHSATALYHGVSAMRQRRWSEAAEAFGLRPKSVRHAEKMLANRHLAMQYGVKPLLSDAYAAGEALAAIHARPALKIFRASQKRQRDDIFNDINGYVYNRRGYDQGSLIFKCTADFQLSVPASLGLTNPASVIWEKTPWSFVADWFIPIGDFLDVAVGAWPNLSGTFVSSRLSQVSSRFVDYPNGFTPVTPGHDSIGWFERTISSHIPAPCPSLKTVEKSLSAGHCENAIALLRGLFR